MIWLESVKFVVDPPRVTWTTGFVEETAVLQRSGLQPKQPARFESEPSNVSLWI